MKIALFGASGGSGRYILKELLKKNYEVNALVRKADSLSEYKGEQRLKLIVGDALDSNSIDNTLVGCDAVIYAIGQRKGSPKDLQGKSISLIIDSMKKFQIKRLICLTGAGVYVEGDKPGLIDNMITTMIKTVSPDRFQDGKNMVDLITKTNLDWTIVRTQLQLDQESSNKTHVGMLGSKGSSWKCSRGFIAKFMVDNLMINDYFNKSPVLSD